MGFYGPEKFKSWVQYVGLKAKTCRVNPKRYGPKRKGRIKDMDSDNVATLYTQRIPESLREEFIAEIINRYVESHHPIDSEELVHAQMVRLEVEEEKYIQYNFGFVSCLLLRNSNSLISKFPKKSYLQDVT